MKYTVTFERIGRDRNPGTLTVDVPAHLTAGPELTALALDEAIYTYVRGRLASSNVDVGVTVVNADGTGAGQILAGIQSAGRFTFAPATEEARETEPRVPLAVFGKDHWSTFAYLETVTVDKHGRIDHDKMRTHAVRHPGEMARKSPVTQLVFSEDMGRNYPTRIKASVTPDADGRYGALDLNDHDDYDCMADLEAAGLLERTSADTVALTALGQAVAAELRSHKAGGGAWHHFQPSAGLAPSLADARRPEVTHAP